MIRRWWKKFTICVMLGVKHPFRASLGDKFITYVEGEKK